MRALTVKQPWAWAIAAGYKNIENRTTNWSYRGSLAIHAGRHDSRRGWASPLVQAAQRASTPEVAKRADIRGAIIGVAEVTDIHPVPEPAQEACCQPWGERIYLHHGVAKLGLVHVVLSDAHLITPIECRGAQGLWTPAPHILQQLTDQLS